MKEIHSDLIEAALEEIDTIKCPLKEYVETLKALKSEIEIRIATAEDYLEHPDDYRDPGGKVCRVVK